MPSDQHLLTVVSLFSGPNFTGLRQDFPLGAHDMLALTIGNDAACSIQVEPGYCAILCAEANFGGLRFVASGAMPTLADFNFQTSSLYVTKAPTPTPVIDETCYYNLRVTGTAFFLTLFGDEGNCVIANLGYAMLPDPVNPRSQFHLTNIGTPAQPFYRITCRRTGGHVSATNPPVQFHATDLKSDLSLKLTGWNLLPVEGTPGAFRLLPHAGDYTACTMGFQFYNGINVAALFPTDKGISFDLLPVVQTSLPGYSATSFDGLKKSVQDYAIQGAFALGGKALAAAEVPGGSALMDALYKAFFPDKDMSRVLTNLYNDLSAEIVQVVAGQAVSTAITDLQKYQTEYTMFMPLDRSKQFRQGNTAAAATDALNFCMRLIHCVSTLVPPTIEAYDGTVASLSRVGSQADLMLDLQKIMSGFDIFASYATLNWAALSDYILILAYSEAGDAVDAQTWRKAYTNIMVAEMDDDADMLRKMFRFVTDWRKDGVQWHVERHDTHRLDGSESIYRWNYFINEQAIPLQQREAAAWSEEVSEPSGSARWGDNDLQVYAESYRKELEFDFRWGRMKQVSCADQIEAIKQRTYNRALLLCDPTQKDERDRFQREMISVR